MTLLKRLTLIILFLAAIVVHIDAADMERLFLNEKGGVFNLLNLQARLIMLDNYKSGAKVPFTNNMEGDSSRVRALTATDITVVTSPAREVTARLLTSGRDSVILVIETFKTPYLDSRLTFYTTDWRRLPEKKHIKPVPGIELFFRPAMGENAKAELLATAIPMATMTLEGDKLAIRHGFKPQVMPEVYRSIEPLLFPVVYYEIKGTKLKLLKSK